MYLTRRSPLPHEKPRLTIVFTQFSSAYRWSIMHLHFEIIVFPSGGLYRRMLDEKTGRITTWTEKFSVPFYFCAPPVFVPPAVAKSGTTESVLSIVERIIKTNTVFYNKKNRLP
jgi:hypothetical protein